jgi:hypothetical protein
MRAANALLIIAPGEQRLSAGRPVEALLVGDIH